MADAHFKIQNQIYYIGDDYKTFTFIKFPKNTQENENKIKSDGMRVFFTDENGVLTIEECVLFNYSSYFKDKSQEIKKKNFIFLIKKANGLNFEYIAEAFSDFLQKINCVNQIFSSFLFVKNFNYNIMYNKDLEMKKDISLQIIYKTFPYDKDKICCTTILNLLYFVFFVHHSPEILNLLYKGYSGEGEQFRENLKKLIKIIAFNCENEIKTIDDNLANIFITKPFISINDDTRCLLNVIYFLLTSQKDVEFENLIVLNTPDDVKTFIKRISPKASHISQNNCWSLLSFMLACSPYEILDDENEYKFTKDEDKVLKRILEIYPKVYVDKIEKGFFLEEKRLRNMKDNLNLSINLMNTKRY